jgi:predicted acyltransferase
MWQGTWDPESILSTFPSIVSGITGMLAGRLLQSTFTPNEKVNYLMTAGVFSAALGYFWGLGFPVNENLWTSSFVLVTSGFAALLLGALYFMVDILGKTKGTQPGIIFGANAIAVYVLGDVLALFFYGAKFGDHSLNQHVVNGLINAGVAPNLASLLYAVFFVSVNFLPAYWLYRKKIFIKL